MSKKNKNVQKNKLNKYYLILAILSFLIFLAILLSGYNTKKLEIYNVDISLANLTCDEPSMCGKEQECERIGLNSLGQLNCPNGEICCSMISENMLKNVGKYQMCLESKVIEPPIWNCLKKPFKCINCLLLTMDSLKEMFLDPLNKMLGIEPPPGTYDFMKQ